MTDKSIPSLDKSIDNQSRNIDQLFQLLVFFWAKRKKILIITSVFVIIGLAYGFLKTPWYESNVKIIPNITDSPTIPSQYAGLAAMAGIDIQSSTEEKMMIYPEIIKSNFVINRLLKHKFIERENSKPVTLYEYFDLLIDSTIYVPGNVSYNKIEKFKKMIREDIIHTDYDAESGILNLKIQFPGNAKLSADIANFIVEQLDDYNKNHRRYKASEQIEFIINSIEETKVNLENAENKFEKYQEQNKNLNSPKNIIEFERLKTELEVQRNLYIELKKRLEITRIEEIKETETLNILESASIPYKKFKPKRLIILIVCLFIGFIFSSLYVLIETNWLQIKTNFRNQKL